MSGNTSIRLIRWGEKSITVLKRACMGANVGEKSTNQRETPMQSALEALQSMLSLRHRLRQRFTGVSVSVSIRPAAKSLIEEAENS